MSYESQAVLAGDTPKPTIGRAKYKAPYGLNIIISCLSLKDRAALENLRDN